ncbi:hypothetical protein V6N13_071912 [Hibiscus sabdariffa]
MVAPCRPRLLGDLVTLTYDSSSDLGRSVATKCKILQQRCKGKVVHASLFGVGARETLVIGIVYNANKLAVLVALRSAIYKIGILYKNKYDRSSKRPMTKADGGGNDDESNKSNSEVHDDEEVASVEDEDEDEDEDDNIQQWNF